MSSLYSNGTTGALDTSYPRVGTVASDSSYLRPVMGSLSQVCSKCDVDKVKTDFYRNRRECKLCYNNNRLCKHDVQKTHCKKCGGSQICIHKIQKSTCRECPGGGSSFCEHTDSDGKKKQKSNCSLCNKSNFCIHDLQINNCIKCAGSSVCSHGKIKHYCIICQPDSKYFCSNCRIYRINKLKTNLCRKCKLFQPSVEDSLLETSPLKVVPFDCI